MIVLLENAERDKIPELVDRVRRAWRRRSSTPAEATGRASIGVAIVPDDGDGVQDLIRRADRRMYEDKENAGRTAAGRSLTEP